MTDRLGAKTWGVVALVAGAAVGCADASRGVPPPPFDDSAARLFFPSALVLSRDETRLYVANASFDQAFSDGTLLEIPLTAFDTAAAGAGATATLEGAGGELSAALLPRFPGRIALARSFDALLIPSQDQNALLVAPLDPAGRITCTPGVGAAPDCSRHAVPLLERGYQDPLPLALGTSVFAGGPAAGEPGVFLSHLSPQSTGNLAEGRNVKVAGLPERALAAFAATGADPFAAPGSFELEIGQLGVSSLAVGPDGRLFLGGCLERVTPELTVTCARNIDGLLTRTNLLRSLAPAAQGQARVQESTLGPLLGGGETQELAFSSDGRWLYVANARPAALLTVEAPAPGGPVTPPLVSLTPLAGVAETSGRSETLRLLVLPRDTGGDLVAVTSFDSDALSIVDPSTGLVVVQLRPVGDGPLALAARRVGDAYRVYVSLFSGCGIAEVEVPLAAPSQARIRAAIKEETCD